MRTVGTFADVYHAARGYRTGSAWDCPMDPVIRREDGVWMLESGIEPRRDADLECTLDTFDGWHYESYEVGDYVPTAADEREFIAMLEG